MMSFFSLPEYLQYTVVFFCLVTLVINIYCVVSCVIFEAQKRKLNLNLLLTAFTSVLFYLFASVNFVYRKSINGHSLLLGLFSE
ncbi:MAG: hypothetical protein IJN88_01025, partial [Clostridia bacterium]|nr:hypothetical protein [Clostridia bacterium]